MSKKDVVGRLARPFPERQNAKAFEEAVIAIISRAVQQQAAQSMPRENVLTLSHGKRWSLSSSGKRDESRELQTLAVEHSVPTERMLTLDLSLLEEFMQTAIKGFVGQLNRFMYEVVSEAAESVGNTITPDQYASLADAFLMMVERVQYGVDANGDVRVPEIHLHPDNAKRFLAELRRQPSEYGRRVRKIQASKRVEALQKEIDRLKRFWNAGES